MPSLPGLLHVPHVESRKRGSHLVMRKMDMKFAVVIPTHGGDVPKGTLKDIFRKAELSVEEFSELMGK
ncbi:MAG: type II toxin-antitoxin system HicA family toxin [Acidobacteria bacterium]|nr:type II toxin-antitoxin system HicA family toxin [Acidobacteriota bacterium]